jgi:cytochrome c oxidase subunit III
MSVMGLFFILIATTAVVWLARQGVMQSPWLEEGEVTECPRSGAMSPPPAVKVGIGVFLAVAGCLFSLLAAAFFMRMEAPDWQMPPVPEILWFNTGLLIASSIALQTAQFAINRGEIERCRTALRVGGASALLFLLGQFWAWRELVVSGLYASGNPANAFFYLLTGTHALHLVGGLVALSRIAGKTSSAMERKEFATSVEVCVIYWHFLLFVWLLLFAMLAGWADSFGVICRRVLY